VKNLGPKRNKVREWRRLHNEELSVLHSSPTIIYIIKYRRTRCAGNAAHTGDRSGAYRIFVGKHEEKGQFGRRRPRGEGNIKMDLQDVGAWTGLIRLGIQRGNRLHFMRKRNLRFHKMQGNS
jgi:hypothetical protein